jgi:hypothetical protein
VRAQFEYLDDKEFSNAKSGDPKEFFDNSFVNALENQAYSRKSA